MKLTSQPFRGGSIMTTVSLAGKGSALALRTDANMSSLFPAWNVCFSLPSSYLISRLLRERLCLAQEIALASISIPATYLKRLLRVIENSPEPQYVSTKCVGAPVRLACTSSCLNIAFWTYVVRGPRMELLFWKKEPAGKSNNVTSEPATRSRTVAL